MSDRYKLVTLGFVAFVTSFGAHVVAVNLPVYAKQIHAGVALIGVLIAVYDFAEIVAKPIFGFIADRRGMKMTMLAGIAIFSIASLIYPFVDPRLLIVIRFGQGLGAAALSIVSAALVAAYFPTSRGRAFGVYNALKGAGYVISPVIGGAIVWKLNFSAIFFLSFAVGLLAFLLSLPLPEPEQETEFGEDEDDLSLSQLTEAFRDRTLLPWYGVIVVNMFLVGILFGFLPVYINSLHYNQLANGILVGTVTASYLLIQPLAGRLGDKYGLSRVIAMGLLLSAIGVLLVPFTSGAMLAAVGIVAGIGVGTVWTNTDAIVSNLASKGHLGASLGAAGSFKELGDMLGPLTIGFLSQELGIRWGFVICGLLGFLSLLILAARSPRAQSA